MREVNEEHTTNPPKQRGIGILSMKLCLKEQAGAFLADGVCGGEVP